MKWLAHWRDHWLPSEIDPRPWAKRCGYQPKSGPWNDVEDYAILENYPGHLPAELVAAALRRTPPDVRTRATELGIDPAWEHSGTSEMYTRPDVYRASQRRLKVRQVLWDHSNVLAAIGFPTRLAPRGPLDVMEGVTRGDLERFFSEGQGVRHARLRGRLRGAHSAVRNPETDAPNAGRTLAPLLVWRTLCAEERRRQPKQPVVCPVCGDSCERLRGVKSGDPACPKCYQRRRREKRSDKA